MLNHPYVWHIMCPTAWYSTYKTIPQPPASSLWTQNKHHVLPDTVQSRTLASQVIHLTVAYSPISVNMVILANLHTAALRSWHSFMDFKYLIMFDNFNCTIIGLVFWEGTHIPYPEPFYVSRAIFRIHGAPPSWKNAIVTRFSGSGWPHVVR